MRQGRLQPPPVDIGRKRSATDAPPLSPPPVHPSMRRTLEFCVIKCLGVFQNTPGVFLNTTHWCDASPCDVRPEVGLTVPDGFLGASGRTAE